MNLEIKLATLQDVATILSIRANAFLKYSKYIPSIAYIKALNESTADIIKQLNNSNIYLAYYNNLPCATIRVSYIDKHTAKITRFGVLSQYTSIGIGSKLLAYILELLDKDSIRCTYLYTSLEHEKLIDFYSKHGFNVYNVSHKRGYPRAKLIRRK